MARCRSPTHSASPISIRRSSMKTRSSTTQYGVLSVQKSVQRLRRAIVLFHPLQPAAVHAGSDRRSLVQRHRLGRQPAAPTPTASRATARIEVNSAHTLRAGFTVSGEQACVGNSSLVEPCMVCDGTDNGRPKTITDNVSKARRAWASMPRTSGRSPTNLRSTPACASTRCINLSTPTSSARG